MICPHCGYDWQPRVEKPRACPMCKQYLEKPKKDKKVK